MQYKTCNTIVDNYYDKNGGKNYERGYLKN